MQGLLIVYLYRLPLGSQVLRLARVVGLEHVALDQLIGRDFALLLVAVRALDRHLVARLRLLGLRVGRRFVRGGFGDCGGSFFFRPFFSGVGITPPDGRQQVGGGVRCDCGCLVAHVPVLQ